MAAVLAAVLAIGTGIGEPPPEPGAERALAELGERTQLAPGVTHRGLSTTAAAARCSATSSRSTSPSPRSTPIC